MEFRLDADQVDLQQTVTRLFEDRFPLETVHEREGAPLDRKAWKAMAEVGILGLLVDPERGGSGLGVLEAALVFELVGSHLVSGPLMWSVLAAPLVEGVTEGRTVATGTEADDEPGPVDVENAVDADLILALDATSVTAHRTEDRAEPEALDPLDPLTSVARVRDLGPGASVGDAADAERLRLVGTVLSAAELVGVASRSLDVARTYALERHQFDVPIGSFQAVKHLLADMYVQTTLAQSATYAAAAVVDHPGGEDPARVAGVAKLLAAEAAIEGASTAVQILGGMGFTWDMLPNYLLKRAWHVAHRFGPGDTQATRLGSDLVGTTR